MSVHTKKGGQKPGVQVPVIAGAVVLIVLLVGWLAYSNFAPPPHAAGPTQESKNDWIAQLAKSVGGDFSKLDPADQQKRNIYTGGKGAELLKAKYVAATH